jgi:hypothetical protein
LALQWTDRAFTLALGRHGCLHRVIRQPPRTTHKVCVCTMSCRPHWSFRQGKCSYPRACSSCAWNSPLSDIFGRVSREGHNICQRCVSHEALLYLIGPVLPHEC